ncbi:hypothetical protein H8356DRAFT_1350820 [Neocallimastix lanati (nom. inval.)]|nr:hypothetical protein H8356DRAFT_1350820 [Neocallimastix sp. JGI-2020a]
MKIYNLLLYTFNIRVPEPIDNNKYILYDYDYKEENITFQCANGTPYVFDGYEIETTKTGLKEKIEINSKANEYKCKEIVDYCKEKRIYRINSLSYVHEMNWKAERNLWSSPSEALELLDCLSAFSVFMFYILEYIINILPISYKWIKLFILEIEDSHIGDVLCKNNFIGNQVDTGTLPRIGGSHSENEEPFDKTKFKRAIGALIYLGNDLIRWLSKKQNYVVTIIAGAKYINFSRLKTCYMKSSKTTNLLL